MADYFRAFCNALGCSECLERAKKVEKGEMSKEEFYEFVIDKHGETEVLKAHQIALAEVKKTEPEKKEEKKKEEKKEEEKKEKVKKEIPIEQSSKPETTVQPAQPPQPPQTQPAQPQTLSEKKEEEGEVCEICEKPTKEELDEVKKRPQQKYKTQFKDICKGCIAAYTLSTLVIMQDWYTKENKKKLQELADKVEQGLINVEDALFEMFKLPGAWEAFDRIMKDFNQVIAYALERASKEIPEVKQKLSEQGIRPEDLKEEAG